MHYRNTDFLKKQIIMKNTIKLAILLLVVNLTLNGQNLLSNAGFETDPTTYTVGNELWRVANFYDTETQKTNPTKDPAADISAGGIWIKKHPNSGVFKATVSTANVHAGTKCLNMYIGAGSAQTGMGTWYNMVNLQKISSSISHSRQYKASVWARVNTITPNVCNTITLFITDNTLKTNLSTTITLTGGTTWTKYETTFDIPTFVAANPTANFATAFFGVGITTTYDGTSKTNYSGVLLDDYSLEAISTQTDYFRSIASGNWDNISTWQSSIDNTSWINATVAPTSTATSINIRNGHEVTVDATATSSILTIDAGGQLTLNASKTLTTNALNIESNAGNGTGTFVDKGGTLNIYSTNNILQNPGFETAPAGYTVSNELWRVSGFQDNTTQILNPTMSATDVSAGGVWIKRHTNTGYLKSKIITTDKKTGTYSLNMYIPATTPSSLNMQFWYNLVNLQRITTPLLNTKKYKATVWARADATAGNVCDKITFFMTDNTNKTNISSVVTLTGGTTWTQYEAIFDIPTFVAANPTADFSTAFFGIGIQSTLQTGDPTLFNYSGVIIDDYTLTEMTNTANTKQYLNGARNWYVSSPVAAAPAPASGIANYYEYIEAGNNVITGQPSGSSVFWKGINTGTTLEVGKGYIAKSTELTTIQFTGAINNAASYPITLKKATNGFNLVGNPYPAFLNWASVYAANSSTANMPTGTIWYRSTNYNGKRAWANGGSFSADEVVYSGTGFYKTLAGGTAGATAPTGTTINTNYSDGGITDWQYQGSVYVFATVNSAGDAFTHNATNLIPPMQAFWVQTSTHNSTLTISKTQISHNGTGSPIVIKAPKSEQSNSQLARLQLSNNATVDEAIVYFNANASNSFDCYDSPKMFNNTATMPEIYTQVGDEKLVINGFKSVEDVTEVPVGFVTQQAGNFTLKLNEFTNFDSAVRVLLTDATKPDVTFDLTDGSAYSFTAAVTPATTNRFSLLFHAPGVATSIENTSKLRTQVFVNATKQITIIAPEKSNYSIYNVVGLLIENGFTNNKLFTVNNKLNKGVYVVKVANELTKVIIK